MSWWPPSDLDRYRRLAGGLLLAVTCSVSGCGESVPPPDRVAVIDGEPISYSRFEAFLQRNSTADVGVLTSDVLSALLDQFLDERLLVRLAVEGYGLAPAADDREVIETLLERDRVTPDSQAIAVFYRQNIARYQLPERVVLRQILFSDRRVAEHVRQQWANGEPYRSLVERLANEPAARVGQEGEFLIEDLPAAAAAVVAELGDGEVSQVQDADYGFHVFQVVRRLPAGVIPLAEATDEIIEELMARQSEAALRRFVTEARERYNVRVFERNVPFNYMGRYRSNEKNQSTF